MVSPVATTWSAITIGFCFPIIGGVLVALRFLTRYQNNVQYHLDDWLCLHAWLCVTGCCASILTGVFKNAFVDAPTTGPDDITEQQHLLAQVTAALVIFWMGANFLIKLTVLFFYRRIFSGNWFNICSWTLIGLSVVWFVYAILSWLLYCGPHLKEDVEGGWLICPLWGFEIQMGVFALDSFIDLCLLLLPIPLIWRLQLGLRKKIAICVVFLVGGLAFVAGLNNTIIQVVYLTNPSIAASGGANFFQGSSLLFSDWPAIEVGVGLIACNLPSLSFQAARTIPTALCRGRELSWIGMQHLATFTTSLWRSQSSSAAQFSQSPPSNTSHVRPEVRQSRLWKGSSGSGSSSGKGSVIHLQEPGKVRLKESRGFDTV